MAEQKETLKSFVEKCAENCNCNAETNTANQAKVLISKLAEEIDNRGGVGGGSGNLILQLSEDGKSVTTSADDYVNAFEQGKTVILNGFYSAWGTQYGFVMQRHSATDATFIVTVPGYNLGTVDSIAMYAAEVNKTTGEISVKMYKAALQS